MQDSQIFDYEDQRYGARAACLSLVDNGAIHNFIDAQMVQRRGITTTDFEGFSVLIPGDRTTQCTRYVPALMVTMGNYSVTDHFFVVDVPHTNVVLGVQWLYSLGRVTIDWKQLLMEFVGLDGKSVVLRGIHSYPPQTISTYRMEVDLRHGDIAWAVELRISEAGGKTTPPHPYIQAVLDRYPVVFGDIP